MLSSQFTLRMGFLVLFLLILGFGTRAACVAQQPEPPPVPPPPLYTEEERKAVVAYWTVPGRYRILPSPTDTGRVNLTVTGSTWHKTYDPVAAARRRTAPDEVKTWETWLTARIAYEKAVVGGEATLPPDPGPIPTSLKEAAGELPPLFERVRPLQYTVTFAPEDAPAPYVYTDNIPRRDRYGYYRSANGVMRVGKQVKNYTGEERKHLEKMFARAGRTDAERRIVQGVSAHEGGFEAINTYDTGWVSIGFIQFITAINGDGSLASVLARHKADDPADFQDTFRRFGIDVAPGPIMAVVDPANGEEKHGAEAVKAIINDKRLTAVFQRAGEREGFRVAQIRVALAQYWPGDDLVTVPVNTLEEYPGGQTAPTTLGVYYGPAETIPEVQAAMAKVKERKLTDPDYRLRLDTKILTVRVADIVRSEAGLATLMDRKVNRGGGSMIRQLNEVAAKVMREHRLTRVEDLVKYERQVVEAMKFRGDFLKDPTLSKP